MRLFEVEFFFSVSFGSLFFKGDEVFLLRPSYSRLAFARFQSSHQSAHVSFYLSLFLKLSPDPIGEEPTGVQRVRCLAGNGIEQKSIIDNSAFRLFPLSPPPRSVSFPSLERIFLTLWRAPAQGLHALLPVGKFAASLSPDRAANGARFRKLPHSSLHFADAEIVILLKTSTCLPPPPPLSPLFSLTFGNRNSLSHSLSLSLPLSLSLSPSLSLSLTKKKPSPPPKKTVGCAPSTLNEAPQEALGGKAAAGATAPSISSSSALPRANSRSLRKQPSPVRAVARLLSRKSRVVGGSGADDDAEGVAAFFLSKVNEPGVGGGSFGRGDRDPR